MSWTYDPFKPMSEKTPADWATDYYIYEQVMGEDEDDFGSGGNQQPTGGGSSGGAGCGCLALVVIILLLVGGISACLDRSNPQPYNGYWATTTTTASTTHSYHTMSSYISTTYSYRYTTRAGTTRDDPYDVHGYIDADDFAAENWEEFDDYDEAYDYYEDYMAGYE